MTFNGFLFLPEMIPSISDKIRVAIIRQSYIDKIERYLGKELIIALVDQRGVGKECSYNLNPKNILTRHLFLFTCRCSLRKKLRSRTRATPH